MTYEFDHTGDLWLLSDFADPLEAAPCFEYGAHVAGMRTLDYEPDVDDYEYQQSIVY